jgi:hypothetical protein
MTWSRGIVGLMRAVTDTDKISGIFFVRYNSLINNVFYVNSLYYEFFQFTFKSARKPHALISSLLVKHKKFDVRPCQYRRQNEND